MIKIRVWEEEIKYMFYSTGMTICEIIEASTECADEHWMLCTDHVQMLFTEIKDKNDKEICESDLVRIQTGCEDEEQPDGYYDIFEVERDKITGHWEPEIWQWEDVEIIGNIYENPELLEEE